MVNRDFGGGNDTWPGASDASVGGQRHPVSDASRDGGCGIARRPAGVTSEAGWWRCAELRPSRSLAAAVEQFGEPGEARGAFRPADTEGDRLALANEDQRSGRARHGGV
jgi:hypothetical protein